METHYSYRIEPIKWDAQGNVTYTRDIATKTFNLYGVKSYRRRDLIHKLIEEEGECLAKLPLKFDLIAEKHIDLSELTEFINGEFPECTS